MVPFARLAFHRFPERFGDRGVAHAKNSQVLSLIVRDRQLVGVFSGGGCYRKFGFSRTSFLQPIQPQFLAGKSGKQYATWRAFLSSHKWCRTVAARGRLCPNARFSTISGHSLSILIIPCRARIVHTPIWICLFFLRHPFAIYDDYGSCL